MGALISIKRFNMNYFNINYFKNISRRLAILIVAALIMLWSISAWFIADHLYLNRATVLIEREVKLADERAGDLIDSLNRNLNYLNGIPDLVFRSEHVKTAVSRFGAGFTLSALPLDARDKQWTDDPYLKGLSQELALDSKRANGVLIFLVNAAGDCIAASNWDAPHTSIGTNFADRDFFESAKKNQHGMQYGVDKATNVPGLYFTSSIVVDDKFLGIVVAKIDMPDLSFLINQSDAFVTDNYGVIVLAGKIELEMHALPDASVFRLTEQVRLARYLRTSFPTLDIRPWGNQRFAALKQIGNENFPYVIATKALPEYGFKVYVESDLSAFTSLSQDKIGLALLLGAVGSLLILGVLGIFLYFKSIMKSKALLWRQANFDTLTTLPNRDMLRDRLEQEIHKSNRSKLPITLFLIDLDHFKEVNDTLGHDFGDILLQKAAQRILVCVRNSDTVARFGGDEFIVVLPQLANVINIEKIAQRIIASLAEPFQLLNEVVHVSASLGIALYPNDASDIESFIKNADQAMYVAKNNGRNRFSYFTPSLQEAAQKRRHLVNDLRVALQENQFKVYYQPIVALSTGYVNKAEALLRWNHPMHGFISPLEFIPLAEETGLIIDIGKWVFNESAVWCKHWDDVCPGGFQVSINKSPIEFMDQSSTTNVANCLEYLSAQDMSGNNFVFEITEGLLLNSDLTVKSKLIALRDAGIQVAIDDFGTGYSALSYLKRFDIDYLKIDQSFVRNLVFDSNDMVLCEAIIVMAHKLGLKVIAEGVETEQQRDLLTSAHCDYAQGYLYSKPVPPEEFEIWLSDRNRR
ncbi:MAG: EAL domain-containing protein [Gallionella sp.]